MNILKYIHADTTPEVYRESDGDLFKDLLDPFGLSSSSEPKPKIELPKNEVTGNVVETKGTETLKENTESPQTTARKTARKGTSKYRIPLEATATGTQASSKASGLKL